MTVREAIRRVQSLNVATVAVEAIEDTKEEFIELQQDQFLAGQNSEGEFLPPYSPAYARKRQRAGLQTEVKDLRFTGEFFDNMIVEPDDDKVNITSDVDYEKWISYHYNKDGLLYGLNDSNLNAYRTGPFWEALKTRVTEQTGLTFSI